MNSLLIRMMFLFLVVLILTILPLPEALVQMRPSWMLLIVLYIQFYLPNYFKVMLVFFLGLTLDSLLSSVIGEHAFCLCFVAWLASGKARHFSLFSMGQQMFFIGCFALLYQLLIFLIDSRLGYQTKPLMIIGTSLTSILAWPWLRLVGEEFLLAASYSRS